MIEVFCNKNRGYKWFNARNIFFKGYLQNREGIVFKGEEAIERLFLLNSFNEFCSFLKTTFGVFSIIICKENETWIANDIAGSMPLYYSDDGKVVSDDVSAIISKKQYDEIDNCRLFELYSTSFVGYDNTVYSHIKQIKIGSACQILDGDVRRKTYYVHTKRLSDYDENEAIKKLKEKTNQMIKRIINVVNDRPIVMSLSGGYDSRYIACSLKDNGVDNVICYTYGREGSFEVEQSRKVARALGYDWYSIKYTDYDIRNLIDEDEYFEYSNRPDYITYLQNYLAIKELKRRSIIPNDAVFVTGLCNDMPTGFYIPDKRSVEKYGYTNEGVAQYNVEQRFVKFRINQRVKHQYENDVLMFMKQMKVYVNDYSSFITALDAIETSGFHSHCYLNMNTVHDYFGYEWLLPCWDYEMLDFWYSLKPEFRINQRLYEDYIVNHIGKKYGVGTKKHYEKNAPTPFLETIKRFIGGIIAKCTYQLGIPLKRNTDINNFAVLEVALYKKIHQKQAIKSDRAALLLLLTIYIMELRYSDDWYNNIKKYLR